MSAMRKKAARTASVAAAPFRLTDWPMHYLASIRRQNLTNMTRALRPLGITPHIWRVLAALADQDGHSVGELADITVIERSNLSRIVDDMEQAGLIERRQRVGDKRLTLVYVTPKGRRVFEQALPIALDVYGRALDGFAPDEFRLFMSFLRRMKENVFRPAYEQEPIS
jgi:DNA-binding MarR family transcriptional regulator